MQQAMDNLMYNRTVIIIAYRLSPIAGSGNILVMADKRVIEQGISGRLLAKRALSGAGAASKGHQNMA